MIEYEHSFPVFCDDPEVLLGVGNKEQHGRNYLLYDETY